MLRTYVKDPDNTSPKHYISRRKLRSPPSTLKIQVVLHPPCAINICSYFFISFPHLYLHIHRCIMSRLGTGDLRRIFENLDKNGDGQVSLKELNWLLEKIGVHHNVNELESSIGKPSLDFEEFLSFYNSILSEDPMRNDGLEWLENNDGNNGNNDQEADLVEAFKVFDLNDDGFISCEELQSVLAKLGLWDERSGRDYVSMIRAYDTNNDGRLNFEEFISMMSITIP